MAALRRLSLSFAISLGAMFLGTVVPVAGLPGTPAAPARAATQHPAGVVAVVRAADGSLAVEHFVAGTASAQTDLLAAVRSRPGVIAADIDVPTEALGGDPLRSRQWPLDTLRAEGAWATSTGAGATVAVLDSGVEAGHPDLRRAVVPGADFTGAGGDGRRDERGHGTHVAGIVAAGRGNGVGTAGLAPDVRILPVKVLDAGGSGLLSWAAQGILWATDHGADVITMSLGASSGTAVLDAAVSYATAKGAVIVAASGNQGASRALWPAAHRDVIAVGASTPYDERADFSNADPALDLVAPGTSVLSTCRGGTWCLMKGTSMATPYVAAAAAMVTAERPHLSPAEVRGLLQRTAVDVGSRGHDAATGWGRLNIEAALRALPPAVDPFTASTTGLRRVSAATSAEAVSVATSAAAFPAGADTAVVARDDVFADSLTGAALAGRRGPVLFTRGGPSAALSSGVATELRRILEPGATVRVLGGPSAVSDRAAAQIAALGFTVERVGGASRIDTAALVADVVRPSPGGRVLLARADHWVDAVTGGAYAAATSTPVLLTGSRSLDETTRRWLVQHAVDEVVLLGGEVALSPTVARDVARLGITVRRVGGDDRAGTATAVARDLWRRRAAANGDRFVVVEGYGTRAWAPAVAAAVVSAGEGAPQLVVATDRLPAATAEYLRGLGYAADRSAWVTAVGGGVGGDVGYALLPLIGR